ncbi:TIR domain-containing protein [Methanosarcina sp. Mfa9]|uniref:TIR domain-containing protein n=1 Tax=Methanosarcina sp. Mfa9 TaxID=3439063 RepID=UPI003F8576E4
MGSKVHKVFVSYHNCPEDRDYKEKFERMLGDTIISKSVQEGDIDDQNMKTETVMQKIRENHLKDSTVTAVLIGPETWKRKFVDWEIRASLSDTNFNPRSGLIGILLPTYPLNSQNQCDSNTIPPRLYDNISNGYAKIYRWSTSPIQIQEWIHEAFERREKINPINSRKMYGKNHNGERWQ